MTRLDLSQAGLAMRRMGRDDIEQVLDRALADTTDPYLTDWERALAGMVAAAATARLDRGLDPARVLGFFDSILAEFRHLPGAPTARAAISPTPDSVTAALAPDLERTPTP
jgi:hypothetical protein